MNKIKIIFLILFFLLGFGLRFYKLGQIPGSMDWDEVSWGYNAYSILHTGRDEYGVKMPMSFRAFGDYKQPIYVYLDSLSIAVFGLNSFAVRFPSALFGALSVIFIYLFLYELFFKEKKRDLIAIMASLIFAISPWSIQFSRVAFEATNGLCLVLVGIWLFFRGVRLNKKWQIILGTLFFIISTYTYHSEKIFTPLIFISLLIYFREYFGINFKNLKTNFINSKTIFTIVLLLIFGIGNIFWVINGKTIARGQSVLFTSNQTVILAPSLKETLQDQANGDKIDQLLHNRRLVFISTYLENYLSVFYPNFLFITGDLERHHAPGMGLLYLISLPFILIGAYLLFTRYKNQISIILAWLLIAPVAEALAGAPNAERALILLPVFIIFEVLGLVYLFNLNNIKKVFKYALLILIFAVYIFNFSYYINQYFNHTNTDYLEFWQGGYKEAIDYAVKNSNGHNIFFDKSIEQGYIFYLFYEKYDPKKYLQSGGSNKTFNSCYNIDNAYFGNCKNIKNNDLYISRYNPAFKAGKIFGFNFLNNDPGVSVFSKE